MQKKLPKWMAQSLSTMEVVTDAKPDDIIIPVMGPTGIGKSTFINKAVGRSVMPVGHDLKSCTANIHHSTIPHPNIPSRRIVFVDTPGFDDTYVDDAEILKRIAVWLARSYHEGMKLAGLIYLHEISQTRMSGSSRKNLTMFDKLCGDDALKNVILATTKWSEVELDMGSRRENQLLDKYWSKMIAQGSRMARFMNTHESAWDIINLILDSDPIGALIQKELVDLQKILPETEAGKTLRCTLQQLLEAQRASVRQLQKDSEAGGNDGLRQRHEETTKQLHSTLHQIQELQVPLGRRILQIFSL